MTERVLIFVCGIVAGLLIGLFLSEDAEAVNRDQLPAMHRVAVDYFGPVSCGEVREVFVLAATLRGDDTPAGMNALARGGGCSTRLSAEFFDNATWAEACETVVHEYGHSVQEDWDPVAPDIQDHSPDRNSVMYPDNTTWPFAPCAEADPTTELMDSWSRECDRTDNLLSTVETVRLRLYDQRKAGRPAAVRRKTLRRLARLKRERARARHGCRVAGAGLAAYGVGV